MTFPSMRWREQRIRLVWSLGSGVWLKGTVLGIYEAVGNAEMNFEKDYYGILGVLPNAPVDVIKAVYRALAKRYHPDT